MPDQADEEEGDAASESSIDQGPGNERGGDHEPNGWIRVSCQRRLHRETTGSGCNRDGEQHESSPGDGLQDQAGDRCNEDSEQSPALGFDGFRARDSEDNEKTHADNGK